MTTVMILFFEACAVLWCNWAAYPTYPESSRIEGRIITWHDWPKLNHQTNIAQEKDSIPRGHWFLEHPFAFWFFLFFLGNHGMIEAIGTATNSSTFPLSQLGRVDCSSTKENHPVIFDGIAFDKQKNPKTGSSMLYKSVACKQLINIIYMLVNHAHPNIQTPP